MEFEKLKQLIKRNNPRLGIEFVEQYDYQNNPILIAKIDTTKEKFNLEIKKDFHYNAYTYIKEINRVKKVADMIGFSYKKGGIVGISLNNFPQKKSLSNAKQELQSAIDKFQKTIEYMDKKNIDMIKDVNLYLEIENTIKN